MHHAGNLDKFSYIVSTLQYYNENEEYREAITEEIAVKDQKTAEYTG
jgi:predicted GIY-YIG superfamily endonuclease